MTLETYLYLIVVILLTSVALAGIILLVKLSWEFVIEPIVYAFLNARYKYYQSECDRMRELGLKWRDRCYKFGIMPDVIDRIDGAPRINYKADANERGNTEVIITLEIAPEEKKDGNTN